jgi:TolB-like protein
MSNDSKTLAREQPSSIEIRAALRRILDSPPFDQAERSKAFLKFAVEETLDGRGDRLRGHTIGVEVFDRPEGFDASADPLVRVEAGRLRRRLAEYHAGPGADTPVRISLPRGSYVAEFSYTSSAAAAKRPRLSRPMILLAAKLAAAVIVAIGGIVFGLALGSRAERAGPLSATLAEPLLAPNTPTILLSALTNLSNDPELGRYGLGLTEELILGLSDLSVTVVTRLNGPEEPLFGGRSPGTVGPTYLLAGSTRGTLKEARISVRLVDASSGEQLWAAAYDQRLASGSLRAEQTTAAKIATVVANPYGPLYAHELARLKASGDPGFARADCTLRFFDYGRTLDPSRHDTAMACLNRVLLRDPQWADGWAISALLAIDAWRFGYGPERLSQPGLERALEHARTALDIESASRLGNVAVALARVYSGRTAHLPARLERALGVVPANDLATRALLAQAFALSGDWQRAMSLTAPSLDLGIEVPGWYCVTPTLLSLKRGEYEKALATAVRIDSPEWFASPLLEAAAAALAGREDMARRSLGQLVDIYPAFPANGRAMLGRWLGDDELVEIIAAGLEKAGLDLS